MSVREYRLCDTDNCNNPTKSACALCGFDRCKEHLGNRYLVITIVDGQAETSIIPTEYLGKCAAVPVCGQCHEGIYRLTKGLHVPVDELPLSNLVTPLRDKLIEAAAALLAEKNLAKKSG